MASKPYMVDQNTMNGLQRHYYNTKTLKEPKKLLQEPSFLKWSSKSARWSYTKEGVVLGHFVSINGI